MNADANLQKAAGLVVLHQSAGKSVKSARHVRTLSYAKIVATLRTDKAGSLLLLLLLLLLLELLI